MSGLPLRLDQPISTGWFVKNSFDILEVPDCKRSLMRSTEPTGSSKRPSSKAAASEDARRTLRYVEPLSDARTKLVDFFNCLLGIGRGVATLPLDAAADAGLLVAVDRRTGEHRIDRCTKIAAGHRLVVAGATVVELPAVD